MLLLAGVTLAAIALLRPRTDPDPQAQERAMAQARAKEAAAARDKRVFEENRTRRSDREAMWRQSGVAAEWNALSYSRFESPPVPGDYETRSLGQPGFRGITRTAILDRRTGDELQIKGGDVADYQGYGSMRVGFNGVEQPFVLFWPKQRDGGLDEFTVDGPLDDATMRVMARLFNVEGFWGSRPIALDRRNLVYFGDGWQGRMQDDQRTFIDAKVDAQYVARGIDPDFGKQRERDEAALAAHFRKDDEAARARDKVHAEAKASPGQDSTN